MAKSDASESGPRRDRRTAGGDPLAELRAELERKDDRIATLEAELEEARDFSRLADRFVDALSHRLRGTSATPTDRDSPEPATPEATTDEASGDGDFGDAMAALAGVADGEDDDDGETTGEQSSVFAGLDTLDTDDPDTNGETADGDAEAPTAGLDRAAAPAPIQPILADLTEFPPRARGMIAHFYDESPASPVAAHLAAGGDGDRTAAYALHRQVRQAGYVAHVGRGKYRSRLTERIADHAATDDEDALAEYAEDVVSRLRSP